MVKKWWSERFIDNATGDEAECAIVAGARPIAPTVCFVSDVPITEPEDRDVLSMVVGYREEDNVFIAPGGLVWEHAEAVGLEFFGGLDSE